VVDLPARLSDQPTQLVVGVGSELGSDPVQELAGAQAEGEQLRVSAGSSLPYSVAVRDQHGTDLEREPALVHAPPPTELDPDIATEVPRGRADRIAPGFAANLLRWRAVAARRRGRELELHARGAASGSLVVGRAGQSTANRAVAGPQRCARRLDAKVQPKKPGMLRWPGVELGEGPRALTSAVLKAISARRRGTHQTHPGADRSLPSHNEAHDRRDHDRAHACGAGLLSAWLPFAGVEVSRDPAVPTDLIRIGAFSLTLLLGVAFMVFADRLVRFSNRVPPYRWFPRHPWLDRFDRIWVRFTGALFVFVSILGILGP
jgi:hypothetical protein